MDQNSALPLVETLVTGLVTMVAAFAGSWYAFRLSDSARVRQTVRERVAAVNRAQFVLIQQFNALKLIQSQIIEPVRQHPARFVAMRSLLPIRGASPSLDVDSLSFLLETDDRELLFRLLIEQQRFETAVQAMNERSRLHLEIVQPKLAAARIMEGVEYSHANIVGALGDIVVSHVQRATDDAIEQVDRTVESCPALVAMFYKAMKARFPDQTIIRLALDEASNQALR